MARKPDPQPEFADPEFDTLLDGRTPCPICGRIVFVVELAYARHRCPPNVLAAIDGAHRRDEEAASSPWPSRPVRLDDGLSLADDDGDEPMRGPWR